MVKLNHKSELVLHQETTSASHTFYAKTDDFSISRIQLDELNHYGKTKKQILFSPILSSQDLWSLPEPNKKNGIYLSYKYSLSNTKPSPLTYLFFSAPN